MSCKKANDTCCNEAFKAKHRNVTKMEGHSLTGSGCYASSECPPFFEQSQKHAHHETAHRKNIAKKIIVGPHACDTREPVRGAARASTTPEENSEQKHMARCIHGITSCYNIHLFAMDDEELLLACCQKRETHFWHCVLVRAM